MYLTFYHLKEEPFSLSPDPRFLQLAEPHRQALLTLTQGVIGRKGLLVLSGPVGTGKTTLIHSLLSGLARRQPATLLPTALIVNPRLERDELVEALLTEFEVPGVFTSKPARLAALQARIFAAAKAGGNSLLIVDEAHLLTPDVLEEIRLLMNIEGHAMKLLQVVLCGQPEIAALLRDPAVKAVQQRIAGRATLRGLSRSETRTYIGERLRIAGREAAGPFSAASVDRIYEVTAGVPRLINTVCDTCLALGCEAAREQLAEDIVEEAAIRHELDTGTEFAPRAEQLGLRAFSDTAEAAAALGRRDL
jgi:general secretion pathway protein A